MEMCPLEADASPSTRTDENCQGFPHGDEIPCKICVRLLLFIKDEDHAQANHGPNRITEHVDEKRGDDLAVATNPVQHVPILDDKDRLADQHDYAELLKHDRVLRRVLGIKLSAYHRESDHDTELQGLANPLKDRIYAETCVV